MNDITPQVPGENPSIDVNRLETLLEQSVDDVVGEFDGLATDEIAQLLVLERAGKDRITLLNQLERELDQREIPAIAAPVADDALNPYANKRAADVDRSKLTSMVLTLDGWLLPAVDNSETIQE